MFKYTCLMVTLDVIRRVNLEKDNL